MVENALDAGATHLRIDVRDGGAALIAVSDDGFGMSASELRMALQRHATSKLRSAEDLTRIGSFGFRGEALPAIASVSRFRIRSRARGTSEGSEIVCDGGTFVSQRDAGGPEGTRIEVADLFAAIPARRKFLKRPGTEWGHIADWLARLALARPDIHVEIQRDDRKATVWPACEDARDRIAMVLSEEDASSLIAVDHDTPAAHVHGYLSTPERTRPNAQGLYLFVNGRPVRDRLLRHALLEAYRDVLPRGRFPVGVVHVDVPSETVDVNVHPAKWEVRFTDPQAIHRSIRHAVRAAMAARSWLGGPPPSGRVQPESDGPASPHARPGPAYGSPAIAPGTGNRGSAPAWETASSGSPATTDDWIFARGTAHSGPHDGEPGTPGSFVGEGGEPAPPPVPSFASLTILGQLRASYLLAESDAGLMVVDQHAAHERILYEGLRRRWLDAGVARQGLLTPLTLELSPSAVAALAEARELTERLGFEVEPFGDDAVLVRAIPAEISGEDVAGLVGELAAALEGFEGEAEADENVIRWLPRLDRLFATMACHSARRFGDRLPRAEQEAILAGLDTIPWAPTCPHGRPVAILVSHEDLELRFRRR